MIGSFMDNHDLPRFNSLTSDKSLSYNALTFTILNGGIPTVYYGTEQDISDGKGDPSNREALWLYNDFSMTASPSYARIASLNKIRSTLAKNPAFVNSVVTAVTEQANDTALARGGALIVLTNVRSHSPRVLELTRDYIARRIWYWVMEDCELHVFC